MIVIALYFQMFFKGRLIISGISCQSDGVFITHKFKKIHLVHMPVFIQAMAFQKCLVHLLHLREQPVILKDTAAAFCLVLHI